MLTDGDCSVVDGGPGCDEGASVNSVNNRYSSGSAGNIGLIVVVHVFDCQFDCFRVVIGHLLAMDVNQLVLELVYLVCLLNCKWCVM